MYRFKEENAMEMSALKYVALDSKEKFDSVINALDNAGYRMDYSSIDKYDCEYDNYGLIMFISDKSYKIITNCNWDEIPFETMFEETETFKTELEMLNWCTENKISIRITNDIELDIVKELIKRNIPEKGKVQLSDISPYPEVFIRIYRLGYFGDDIGWGSGENVYLENGSNGHVEFETLYGWLD